MRNKNHSLTSVLRDGKYSYVANNGYEYKHTLEANELSSYHQKFTGLTDGQNLIHIAVRYGRDLPIIYKLLTLQDDYFKQNTQLSKQDQQGNTPLHYAIIYRGSEKDVLLNLLKHGHDVDATLSTNNNNQQTPLKLAIRKGRMNLVDILLRYQFSKQDAQEDVKLDALATACRQGRFKLAKEFIKSLLLDQTFNNQTLVAPLATFSGNTLLHLAAYSGNSQLTRYLLDLKAINFDLTAENGQNKTATDKAIHRGHYQVAALIFSHQEDDPKYKKNAIKITSLMDYMINRDVDPQKYHHSIIGRLFTGQPKSAKLEAAAKQVCQYFDPSINMSARDIKCLGAGELGRVMNTEPALTYGK